MYIVYMSPVAHFTWIYVKIIIWETNCLRQTKLLVLVHVEKIFHWNYRDCPCCGIIFIRWANLIFVDYQNFAGLLGHNFMGYWFAALLFKTIHNFVIHPWGSKFLCKGKSQNPPPLISHKQWQFHSYCTCL